MLFLLASARSGEMMTMSEAKKLPRECWRETNASTRSVSCAATGMSSLHRIRASVHWLQVSRWSESYFRALPVYWGLVKLLRVSMKIYVNIFVDLFCVSFVCFVCLNDKTLKGLGTPGETNHWTWMHVGTTDYDNLMCYVNLK